MVRSKIKLTVTHTKLFIRAPNDAYKAITNILNLKILIREIRNASIKDFRSPEVQNIFCTQTKRFKILPNRRIFWDPCKYAFTLKNPSQDFMYNTQFIYIELQDRKHILIEFDDAPNFVRVLKQRIHGESLTESES